jgi:geranylgeranyl pyrophosphate synthase
VSIQQIFAPIQNELQQIEARLRETVRVEYIPLANIFEMLIGSGGKRIRPALCVLATRFHPTDPEQAITLAISTELVHAATLIHDDLIDKTAVRRGSPTVNSRWSGTATVLAGDFLLARAADIAASIENFRVMRIFAQTLMTICEGEIRQDFARSHWPPNRQEYYRHIESKTASLFVAATEGGAILSGAPENEIAALKEYGRNLGMAFQMVDDILDFTADENELGKPVGSDLRQGTFTLPIFYYLEQDAHAKTIGDFIGTDIERLIDAIRNSSAIAAAKAEAQRTAQTARAALAIFPDNLYRRALLDLADYVVERTL